MKNILTWIIDASSTVFDEITTSKHVYKPINERHQQWEPRFDREEIRALTKSNSELFITKGSSYLELTFDKYSPLIHGTSDE